MPLLMMMMAVGGKAFKTGGLGMLGAMSGMMEGSAQGSLEAFDRAKKQYDEHYQQIQDEWKNKQIIVDRMEKALGKRMDARKVAIEMAGEAIGDAQKEQKNVVGEYNTHEKTMAQLARQTAQIGLQREKLALQKDRKRDADREKAMTAYEKTIASWPKITASKTDLQNALSLLPKVVEKFKSDKTYFPGYFSNFLASSADPEISRFRANLETAKPMLMALETSGQGLRSNMLLQAAVGKTVPVDVWSENLAAIDQKTRNDVALINTAYDQQKCMIEMRRHDLETKYGVTVPPVAEYVIPPSAMSDAGGVTGGSKPSTSNW